MVVKETPFTEEEIHYYISIEKTIFKGNNDFENWLIKKGYDINWYVENTEYKVIEVI